MCIGSFKIDIIHNVFFSELYVLSMIILTPLTYGEGKHRLIISNYKFEIANPHRNRDRGRGGPEVREPASHACCVSSKPGKYQCDFFRVIFCTFYDYLHTTNIW
ncbi:unnamed protein product [Spodoptera exigua]|nr:unnamed protein product [Spodoptera exigua]